MFSQTWNRSAWCHYTLAPEQASICFAVTPANSFVLAIHCHLKTGCRAHGQLDNIIFSANTPTVFVEGFPHQAPNWSSQHNLYTEEIHRRNLYKQLSHASGTPTLQLSWACNTRVSLNPIRNLIEDNWSSSLEKMNRKKQVIPAIQ